MRCCKCLGSNVSIGDKEQYAYVASTRPDGEIVPLRDRNSADILAGEMQLLASAATSAGNMLLKLRQLSHPCGSACGVVVGPMMSTVWTQFCTSTGSVFPCVKGFTKISGYLAVASA